jgi:hypothetical protein
MDCGSNTRTPAVLMCYMAGKIGVLILVFCPECAKKRFGGVEAFTVARSAALELAEAMRHAEG